MLSKLQTAKQVHLLVVCYVPLNKLNPIQNLQFKGLLVANYIMA